MFKQQEKCEKHVLLILVNWLGAGEERLNEIGGGGGERRLMHVCVCLEDGGC